MIIDTHQHVFWHGRNDADLVADMDAHGIEQAWLLSWEVPPARGRARLSRGIEPAPRPPGRHPRRHPTL